MITSNWKQLKTKEEPKEEEKEMEKGKEQGRITEGSIKGG